MLNKTSVLDNGWIARVSSSNDSKAIRDIQDYLQECGGNVVIGKKIPDIASLTVIMRCPLFVQLNLSTYNFNITSVNPVLTNVDAYVPDESEITANTTEDKIEIRNYLKETTEALLLNIKALPMDGCDRFTAQIVAPVSTYNEIIVHGSLRSWLAYIRQGSIPRPLCEYRSSVRSIMLAEWPDLDTYTI